MTGLTPHLRLLGQRSPLLAHASKLVLGWLRWNWRLPLPLQLLALVVQTAIAEMLASLSFSPASAAQVASAVALILVAVVTGSLLAPSSKRAR